MTVIADPGLVAELERVVAGGVSTNVPLNRVTRWKIGGKAAIVVEPASAEEVAATMRILGDRPDPVLVMGHASNLLFDSAGFDGTIVKIADRMSTVSRVGDQIRAQAGIWVPCLARSTATWGLTGIEHTIGIPGTLGGLVLMNGGSKRRGIGDHVEWVRFVSEQGAIEQFSATQCDFGYRRSALQSMRAVVVEVGLALSHGDPAAIRHDMIETMISRRRKFPKNLPNGGSTFLSSSELYETIGPPGKVIEMLGLKGVSHGGAQISPLHANFIVNVGDGTDDDVLNLIHLIRRRAFQTTGHRLLCEVRHVAANGTVVPAHDEADRRFGKIGVQ